MSFQLQGDGLRSPALGVVLGVEGKPHSVFKPRQAAALHGSGMDKDIAPAIIRRDEAEALVLVEEFDLPCASHVIFPGLYGQSPATTQDVTTVDLRKAALHSGQMLRTTLILLLALSCPAYAADKTLTLYYPVKGTTAKEINADIKKNGTRIARSIPYSFTAIATKVTKPVDKSRGKCRYKSYRISAIYTYVLPKLSSTKGMSKTTLSNWNALTKLLAAHEPLHRTNWRGCFTKFEGRATEVMARDCDALSKKVDRLFTKEKLACLRNDREIDARYLRELWKQPFVREGFGNSTDLGRNIFALFGRKTP